MTDHENAARRRLVDGCPMNTPGPWIVIENAQGYPSAIVAPNGSDIMPGAVGARITRSNAITFPSSAEGRANARLIAAAPDLADALAALAQWCEHPQNVSTIDVDLLLCRARAALGRAGR